VNKDFCFAGEWDFQVKLRPVNRVNQRIQEAEKLGFRPFCFKYNKIALKKNYWNTN
jgi:DNA repair protein RadA/Sms